ncbi:MAG: hypothetical protein HFJ26_01795 [Clostridia bacterium]|nr:hypothetical protein [Clostridia bacterium]
MVIKNIFNIKNYKGLPDGFKVNFEDITYIIGDNAKNKTTIGALPLWILTGYNLTGSNREEVSNCNNTINSNTLASMTIVDNLGSEHTITRCKGKDNFVMMDDIRTSQEFLTRFYKDVHAFICSYYPNYFRSLKLAEQRDLLLRILPSVSAKDAFKLLEKEEQEILGGQIVDIKGFCKARRAEIKELKSDLDNIKGSKNVFIDIAVQKEESPRKFEKQQELDNLEKEYEKLIENTDNIISLEDLEKDITKLENKINCNINVELQELQMKQRKELEKLKNVASTTATCPTCKQEINNENLIKSLKITYKKSINSIAEKIETLKKETQELIKKKKEQTQRYTEMKTPEMQEKAKRRDALKVQINILQEEKSKIDLFNKEVEIKHNEIINAKEKIEQLNKSRIEMLDQIDKYTKQVKIATRLNLLINQEQMKRVKDYLKNVTIEFSGVDEETGEIIDVYEVKYCGRKYEKLSKSYKLRADIEIATLINKVTGINTPMFIDDVESITQISSNPEIQIMLAIVVKYNDLEILYDYSDVLIRERDSINKKIEESSKLLQNAA